MTQWIRGAVVVMLLVLTACLWLHRSSSAPLMVASAPITITPAVTASVNPTAADVPSWPAASVLYTIYPSIFSPQGNFAGITAQMGRLKRLGVTDVWVMPVTPVGKAINGHPAVNSPYAVQDYYAVNPQYGSAADLKALISRAHALGLRVILDEVLNHTSWDNALITQHPEYYAHTDNDLKNPATVKMAFDYADVAQLNYANPDLRAYMAQMLRFWIKKYHADGFRFDTADNPSGPHRMIPADFWQGLGVQLRQIKPDILLLGEEETPDLAMKPFSLDYSWNMYNYGPFAALTHTLDATTLQYQWQWPYTINVAQPAGMRHMNIQDDWDKERDVVKYGGPAQALAAAAFNFTIDGIPLIYNGMEVGNSSGGVNPHTQIDWSGPNASTFTAFYTQLLKLRNGSHGALQQGPTTWVQNSRPKLISTYSRGSGRNEYLMEINTAASTVSGTLSLPSGGAWTDVTPAEAPGGRTHIAPPNFSLKPYDFAIFHRSQTAPKTAWRN